MSKLRENWLIRPQNRLNLHDLVVKRGGGGGRGRIGPYLDPPQQSTITVPLRVLADLQYSHSGTE